MKIKRINTQQNMMAKTAPKSDLDQNKNDTAEYEIK
jgi:hypothetical protein